MGYWEHDVEYDYGRNSDPYSPHTHRITTLKLDPPKGGVSGFFGGVPYTFDPSRKYKHSGNNSWYHPTDCGRWVPVAGQGMEIYPRTLNEDYLIGYEPATSFKKGDIVRLKTGTAPIRVEIVSGRYFTGEYVSSGTRVVARPIKDIVLHEDYNNVNTETETKGTNKMADNKTLYEMTLTHDLTNVDFVVYGHYLATNSSGQWVMEEKGTGKIHTVDKSDVVEVLPYTISIRFLNDNGMGKNYNYFADKDKYTAGQMFLMDNSFVIVVDVDTKSKLATKDFKPTVEILTKKVG